MFFRDNCHVFKLCAGQLEMHHETNELRAWIDRPSYGPPSHLAMPTSVPSKCTVLEGPAADGGDARQCSRSTRCSKPDGHPGFCVGATPGPRNKVTLPKRVCDMRFVFNLFALKSVAGDILLRLCIAKQRSPQQRCTGSGQSVCQLSHVVAFLQARAKVCSWPQEVGLMPAADVYAAGDAHCTALDVADLPSQGVLCSVQLTAAHLASDWILMPGSAVLKVPEHLAHAPGLKIPVEGVGNTQHVVMAAPVAPVDSTDGPGTQLSDDTEPDSGSAAGGAMGARARPAALVTVKLEDREQMPWLLGHVQPLLQQVQCDAGDEIGIKRCALAVNCFWTK